MVKLRKHAGGGVMANKNLDDFNKALKTKLEDAFGKEFINDKVIIMGLDDVDDNEDDEQPQP